MSTPLCREADSHIRSETDLTGTMETAAELRRRSSTGETTLKAFHDHMEHVVQDMESLGIVTQIAGKVVGGVAVTQSYYQHVLTTEGKVLEGEPCQLLITRLDETGLSMMPATQAQLEEGHPGFPRESPVLSKIMSPAAMAELHWTRVPAVVIFGCFVADEDELQEAEAAGIPISPSMAGPHPEELMTQMEVFFKQYTYPDNKCFILRDWGFLIFGNDLRDAMETFNMQLKEALAGDKVPGSETAAEAPASPKTPMGALAHAFRRLRAGTLRMLRTQSAPADDIAEAAGPRSPRALASKQQFAAMSEPSSPMIAAGDLPDSIRNISITVPRTSSEAYRCPSFQTGFKPW